MWQKRKSLNQIQSEKEAEIEEIKHEILLSSRDSEEILTLRDLVEAVKLWTGTG